MNAEDRKVYWRCRRGMQELDVMLERYFNTRYQSANLEERRAFELLLELPDPQLAAWLIYGHPCSDKQLVVLIDKIRTH